MIQNRDFVRANKTLYPAAEFRVTLCRNNDMCYLSEIIYQKNDHVARGIRGTLEIHFITQYTEISNSISGFSEHYGERNFPPLKYLYR